MKNLLAFAFLICMVSACGSADPQELADKGAEALNAGQYPEASACYGKALAALQTNTSSAEWRRAKLGWIQAQTRIDAAVARDEFLSLASANPTSITDREYSLVGSRLGDAGKLEEAIAVLTAGMEANPESLHLQALVKELGDKAKSTGSAGALESLKGLGYVGGD